MKEFEKIYLSWRSGRGNRRHIIGVLQETPDGRFEFNYDQPEVSKAKTEGFTAYTEFPEITKPYNGNVLDVFAQRLTKKERPDIQNFYNFWEIDEQYTNDNFYLLAHTQGLLPTDNFEFLADYNPVQGLHFLTELAGLSKYNLAAGTLKEGDSLHFEIDEDNEFDKQAVKVFKGDTEIGYVKKIHCRIFHKPNAEKLKLTVKAIEQNGIVKRVFIKIFI